MPNRKINYGVLSSHILSEIRFGREQAACVGTAWVAFLLVAEAAHEGAHCVIWGHL